MYAVLDVSVDVTSQIIARQKIEESESRFRLLADASPNLIWMLNPDGSYGFVNTTTLDFLNISQEQIAAVGWEPYLHPDDVAPAVQAITRAVESNTSYEMEHRLLHRNGEYRWVFSQAMPAYNANGTVYAYIGSSTDIHEAKKSRAELQTALEQARLSKEAAELGTFDLDLEKNLLEWDDRCRTLFGIGHKAKVTYEKDFVGGLHQEDRKRVLQVIDRSFNKSLSNGDYDVEYRTVGAEDGFIRWIRAKGKVYFDAQENPVRFIGSVLDITAQVTALQKIEKVVEERTRELAKANEALVKINQDLKRSNTNLEEFAHAASHDMKEPIRKVLTFTDRLKSSLEKRMTDAEKLLFDRVENATQRMGLLIDDLLEFSHMSVKPMEKDDVDLNKKLFKVITDMELRIEEKGALITIGQLPVIKGYRRQLQQLFQNLIDNALKYSKFDVPPVIGVSHRTIAGHEVPHKVLPAQLSDPFHLLEVCDNGIGFEMEYAERIFGMFQRLHGKSEYPGTGIGLSIARKVVENHNGYIWAESSPGRGANFKVLLPIQ